MIENVIAETVRRNGVIDIVILIGVPIVRQLLRTEDKDRLVPVLVVFDDCESSKGFTKANTIGKNATIELFQFVDDGKSGILLEIVEHAPNLAFLKACGLIGENVFGYVLKKLAEDIIEGDEVDEIRRVFVIGCGDIFDHFIGYHLHSGWIIPKGIEKVYVGGGERCVRLLHHVICIVSPLASKIHCSETLHRHIVFIIDVDEAHHVLIRNVGLECNLRPDPVRALF